jgi:anti-sigma factor RsiW
MMSLCNDLEPLVETIADGSLESSPEHAAHFESCDVCRGRLARARSIHALLATREAPTPPASFTSDVMARIQRERWRGEQVVDLGFNLAIAAGVLLIVGGALGLAWSFGLLTFGVDARSLLATVTNQWVDRAVQQLQTIVTAIVLLTMALGLWWWIESSEFQS